MSGTRRRLRYLWRDSHPDTVELLTAALSLWFGAVLLWPGTRTGPALPWFFAAWALAAGACKVYGVVAERRTWRLAGLGLGAGFWIVLAAVFGLSVRGGITYGGFIILAASQGWGYWRVRRP